MSGNEVGEDDHDNQQEAPPGADPLRVGALPANQSNSAVPQLLPASVRIRRSVRAGLPPRHVFLPTRRDSLCRVPAVGRAASGPERKKAYPRPNAVG